jgi:hypothetical protein
MISGRTPRALVRQTVSGLPALGLAAALTATLLVAEPVTDIAPPGAPSLLAPAADRAPVTPDVEEVSVDGASRAGLAVPGARSGRDGRALAALSAGEQVDGFAVAGATWEPGTAPARMVLEIRTSDAGRWSPWEEVEVHEEHGPDPGSAEARNARDGSDAVVLGDVDEVQTRVTSPSGEAPEGLHLAVVESDPVAEDEPTEPAAIDGAAADGLDTVASAGPPRPRIYSRAQWGADEGLRNGSPSYAEVNAGFVHHTVNANGYTMAQVPSILRSIYAYHTKSRGWSDIGYNFLVDRFGRIWEGRYGGVTRAVVGAHTLGYNDDAFAMSAIGNFETAQPSSRMLDAYGRLMGWKLALHGVGANQTRNLDGRTFAAISGHRDAGQTACPGRYLYAKLGAIRNKAAAYQQSGTDSPRALHDLIGSAKPDLLVRDRRNGALKLRPGGVGPRFGPQRLTARRLGGSDFVLGSPDLTGDGRPDIVERAKNSKITRILRGRGGGQFTAPGPRLTQFRAADLLTAAGDMNGDGRNDLISRTPRKGHVWFYPGNGSGGFGRARLLLRRKSWFEWMVGVGDVDGDRHRDLVALDPHGRLRLFRGNGKGGLRTPARVVARGWAKRVLVTGGVSTGFNRKVDLVARDRSDGRVWMYQFDADGDVYGPSGGWLGLRNLNRMSAVPDVTGDGKADLVARRRHGRMVVLAGNHGRWLGAAKRTGGRDEAADLAQSAGDWNGDGLGDALVRRTNGRMHVWSGNGSARLTRLPYEWRGWHTMRHIVPAGDVSRDGVDDLWAQDNTGRMWVYPGTGTGRAGTRYLARGAMIDSDLAATVGRWNNDAYPDLVVRKASTGALFLYLGDARGRLGTPTRLGGGHAGYDRIVGHGDVNGDKRPDLVAREARTGHLWLLPGTGQGLGRRHFMAPGVRYLDLIG